jgi:hypothetical protein
MHLGADYQSSGVPYYTGTDPEELARQARQAQSNATNQGILEPPMDMGVVITGTVPPADLPTSIPISWWIVGAIVLYFITRGGK